MLLHYYTAGKNKTLEKSESIFEATPLFYINMPDGEKAPVFDYKNFPFQIFKDAPTIAKKGKTGDKVKYYNLACSFDIETTTLEESKEAFMYQWQYCIEDYVFMGKTWEEFVEFNSILTAALDLSITRSDAKLYGRSLVCYIHNLSYEFMFAQYFMGDFISPLFTDINKPLVLPTEQGITYRCAYRLTNKSLEQFTKGLPHAKLAGDLDYSKIRTPQFNDVKNGLTDLELAYCYNDVKGLSEALRDIFTKDTKYNIATIPLTSTGYVRKDCRASMRKNPKWRAQFEEMRLTPHLYQLCRLAFRGGNTHSNAALTNMVVGLEELGGFGGLIRHKDETSAYPAQMLTKGFPMSKFEPVNETENIITHLDLISKRYCLLLKVVMTNVKYIGKFGVPYIAKSKSFTRMADKNEIIEDNGRIYAAPVVMFACTEIDLKIILRDYSYDKIEFLEAYKAKKGLLPYEFRRVIIDYYEKKTALKHSTDPNDIYEYNRAKENLNTCYGMICMKIDRCEYDYNDGDFALIQKPLNIMLNDFYDSESSFLPYQWALWVTSEARAALDVGMQICGPDLIYTDTDSVFYIGDHEEEFEALNNNLINEAYKYNAVAYNKKGEAFPIGVWDAEPDVKLMKTLGAKKYLLSFDGEHIESTIAGVSKDIGQEYFNEHGFKAFSNETIIPVSGKVTAYYNNVKPHKITIDGVEFTTASNIALINASYTIHVTNTYQDFLNMIIQSLEKTKS